VFEGWPHFDLRCTPLDHWKWKYAENPMKSIIISVCMNNNEVIGCTHRIPKRVKIGDSVFLCCSGSDSAVHPQFQDRKAYSKMIELLKDLEKKSGTQLSYSVTSNPKLIKFHMKHHKAFPHSVSVFLRVKDVDYHLRMTNTKRVVLYKCRFFLVKTLNKLKYASSSSNNPEEDFRILGTHCFDDRIGGFWNRVKDHYVFIVERTKDYLNWRYCDPRGGDYIVKIAEGNGEVLGYIVARINTYCKDYPIGYIVDLITFPERLDVADALVRESIRDFDQLNINTVRCQIAEGHPYRRILEKCGFVKSHSRVQVFLMPNVATGKELEKILKCSANRIHFVYGDYDDI
jgi:RimJ/RimL family protein N-acetyltransferase